MNIPEYFKKRSKEVKASLRAKVRSIDTQILEEDMSTGDWKNYPQRSNNIHRYETHDGSYYVAANNPSSMANHMLSHLPPDGVFRIPDPYARDMYGSGMQFIEAYLWTDPIKQVFKFIKLPHREVTLKEINACSDITQVQDLFLTRFYEPAVPAEGASLEPEEPEEIIKTYKDELENTRDIDL